MDDLFRFPEAQRSDPAVAAWFEAAPSPLGDIAGAWFDHMRACGDDVRELIHDRCPVACVGDAAFAYVNVLKTHVNVGFYQGATLPDPARLLEGEGKRMRHVKLRFGDNINDAALNGLIEAAYRDMKRRTQNE